MGEGELDALFASATAGEVVPGKYRGRILMRTDSKRPRLRARLEGTIWKGKEFYCDGSLVNRWPLIKAGKTRAGLGQSWYDGLPCAVVEYTSSNPMFRNTRDELRELAPGLYLARFYERRQCPHLKGYFVLELECCKK
jgi:hypothetical protein